MQGQPQQELEVEEVVIEQVAPQVEVTPEVKEAHEVKVEVVGGARSKRLQKLNRAEEEAGFKKRR